MPILIEKWSRRQFAIAIAILLVFQSLPAAAKSLKAQFNVVAAVYFSPNGGCTDAIVAEIDHAKSEVLIQAYSFTNTAIAKALVNAHTRGVKVQVILDKKQKSAKGSVADYEQRAGVPVFVDQYHNAAHNKVMIIDGSTVITGSFNFTKAAETKNAENLLIIRSSAMAQLYLANWKDHRKHSGEYVETEVVRNQIDIY